MGIGRILRLSFNFLCHSVKLVFSSLLTCVLKIFSRGVRTRHRKLRLTQALALFLLTWILFALKQRVWFSSDQSQFMQLTRIASDPWMDSLRVEEIFDSQKTFENPCLPMVKDLVHRSKLRQAIQQQSYVLLNQNDLSTMLHNQNLSAECVMQLRLKQTLNISDPRRQLLFTCFKNCQHTSNAIHLLQTQLQKVLDIFVRNRITYFLDVDSTVGALQHHGLIPWQSPTVNLRIERASDIRHTELLHSLRNDIMVNSAFVLTIQDTLWKLTCIENNAVQLNIRFFQFIGSAIQLLEYKCKSFNEDWLPCAYNITDVFPLRFRPFINIWIATPRSILNLVMTEMGIDYFFADSCPKAFSRQSTIVNCLDPNDKEHCDAKATLPCEWLRQGHWNGRSWQAGMNFVSRLWIRGEKQGFLELLIGEITLRQVAYLPM